MFHLFDLPNEIISMIVHYLDGFSRIRLSKSCKRFNYFFIQNSITRHTSFPFHYNNEYTSDNCSDIQTFIKNNHAHITHLDLSYSHWKYNLILRVIKNIANLKYLNVIGTDIYRCSISTVLQTNTSIDSVEYTYNINCGFPMKKLKYLHIVIDWLDNFQLAVTCLKNTVVDELKITAPCLDFEYFIMIMAIGHVNEITVRFGKTMPVVIVSLSIPGVFYDKYYIAIETTNGIYTSPEIIDEFISMNSLIKIKSIENLRNGNAVSVYFCSKNLIEELENFKNKIKNIISKRSSINIALHASKFSPKMHFDIVEYLALLQNIKRLSIHPRVLTTKAQPREKTSVLEKIATAHRNIEMLQVIGKINSSCLSGREWTLDPRYLESIVLFRKLKYLTLTYCPHIKIQLLKAIFEQCPLLEQLSITTMHESTIENILENLNICQNLRTLHLDSPIDIIHIFLDSMESSTLSSVYITYYDESYRVKENELQNSLMNIPSRCPRLRHLTVYNATSLPAYQIRHLSRIEKYVNRNNNSFVVNLITQKNLSLNRINDIGQFI